MRGVLLTFCASLALACSGTPGPGTDLARADAVSDALTGADAGAKCLPGDRRCAGLAAERCSEAGSWTLQETCATGCEGGSCTGGCIPGSKDCQASTPRSCSAQGSWLAEAPCPYLCVDGACQGVCVPGTKQCAGNVPQSCGAASQWSSGAPCPVLCSGGACADSCSPGAKQCSGLTPQTCGASGSWVNGTACPYLCVTGACAGVCKPGQKQCSGSTPQTCSASGAWVSGPACPCACAAGSCSSCGSLFVEAESFSSLGGWQVDSQFVETMGSPYLLAHGLGKPVANATVQAHFPSTGSYRLWVRTKDWVPPHKPGIFQVAIGGQAVLTNFGTLPSWGWQDGGTVSVSQLDTTLSLVDKTGFDGRCDALYWTQDLTFVPPSSAAALLSWRRKLLGIADPPPTAGSFDLIVVGGGIAGASATLAAARLGLSVALIHDRAVVGGNASQEVRVHTCGYSGEGFAGKIVDELRWGTACTADTPGSDLSIGYDQNRGQILAAEPNAQLFLEHRAVGVQASAGHIQSIDAISTRTGALRRFFAPLVVDATGDGWIGYWAGASFRMGREAQSEFGESLAPTQADLSKLGSTVLWKSKIPGGTTSFPDVSAWTSEVAKDHSATKGQWYWEYGIVPTLSTIDHAEEIRDHLLRAAYGTFYKAWSPQKTLALDWVGYIAGKRESRRLMGDYILREQDIRQRIAYPDTIAVGSWPIDLHYPNPCFLCCGTTWGQSCYRSWVDPGCTCAACTQTPNPTCLLDFMSTAVQTKVYTFGIPYRCLYSKDIDNLLMAGRNISVSHVALGGTRVQPTNGQMGVAVAAAAKLCKKYGISPRGVYQSHLSELISTATSLSQPLGPLIRLGYVQSDGANSWSQTCEMSGAGVQDCELADHPFSTWTLPPAGMAPPDPGTYISDRYAFVYRVAGARKLRNGFVQSNGAKSWSQTCDIDATGTTTSCGGFSTYGPPAGMVPDSGQVINARYAFVFNAGAVQRLHNGFVQSNGARSWALTCDLDAAGNTTNCDPIQQQAFPLSGFTPDVGQFISDRYAFVYRVNGAQKLRNGFMQSDGTKSWSQTCDISSAGVIDCSPATHPFQQWNQPPPGFTADPGTVANHRYEFVLDPY